MAILNINSLTLVEKARSEGEKGSINVTLCGETREAPATANDSGVWVDGIYYMPKSDIWADPVPVIIHRRTDGVERFIISPNTDGLPADESVLYFDPGKTRQLRQA